MSNAFHFSYFTNIFVTKLGFTTTLTMSHICISTAPSMLPATKNHHPSKAPHLPVMLLGGSATYFLLNSSAKAIDKREGKAAIISSGQTLTDILNLHCDLNLNAVIRFFRRTLWLKMLWLMIEPSLLANTPAV